MAPAAKTAQTSAQKASSKAAAATKQGAARRNAAEKSAALAQRIGALCQEFKANDITILSLDGVSDMTDFFVIVSGTSDTHVRSTAQRLEDELKKEGQRPAHTEGIEQGRWAILDYVDVVVHLFHPAMRSYYQLERLWGDATVVPLKAQGAKA